MAEKEYIIFCDESEKHGRYYSNFYGGLIVAASHYERVTRRLEQKKLDLNLYGEVKWEKVTQRYLPKYQELIRLFFEEVIQNQIKVRIMFRQNAQQPQGLTPELIEMEYFVLYYQFIKHAFGLGFLPIVDHPTQIRLYFDQFPDTREKIERFKGYLNGLSQSRQFQEANIIINREDITEVRSHEHVLLQCLDIVLGAIAFRLNDKHKDKPLGEKRRGKRTIAKETLYKTILAEIRKIHPNFNIGITTRTRDDLRRRWESPYLHWCFTSRSAVFDPQLTKRGRRRD